MSIDDTITQLYDRHARAQKGMDDGPEADPDVVASVSEAVGVIPSVVYDPCCNADEILAAICMIVQRSPAYRDLISTRRARSSSICPNVNTTGVVAFLWFADAGMLVANLAIDRDRLRICKPQTRTPVCLLIEYTCGG